MLQGLPELVTVAVHTFVIYLFLTLSLSLLSHRQMSELGLVELAVIMIIGSSVETSMVAGDTSLPAGLTAAATLLVSNRVFSILLERWKWLRQMVVGRPIPVVYKGRYLGTRMRQAGLTEDDILEGIRERGYEKVDQVRLAVLEIDGTISVVPWGPSPAGEGESG